MTDYDPKPTAVHQQERYDDNDGGGIGRWLWPLLLLLGVLAALYWFFQPRVDMDVDMPRVEVEGGDIDADMSINPADIDVDLPSIDIDGGDVDMNREGRQDVDLPDVDVDVEGGNIDLPEVDVDVNDD